jgi:predicted PurR-regulated permease PerM
MVTPPDRPRPAALFRTGVFISLGVVATLLALYGLYAIRVVLVQVLVALFIAVSLEPAVHWLTARGMRRGLAVTAIFAVVFGLLLAFLISVTPQLVTQGRELIDDLPGYLAELQARSERYRGLNDRFNLSSQLQGLIGSVPTRIGSGVLGFTGRLFGALVSALTVLVFTAYFMAALPRIRNGLVRLFPVDRRLRARQVVDLVVDKVGLIGATLLGLVGALMAIPVAAALNVLLNERLAAHEAAVASGGTLPPAETVAAAPDGAEVRGSGPGPRG